MGAAASTIPMQVDKELFRKLCGGTGNDGLFDQYSTNGLITREKLIELSQTTDCYLSHDWGMDLSGQNILDRVSKINLVLQNRGLVTYCDTIEPTHASSTQSCTGIDKTRCVVVFLTASYFNKISNTAIAPISPCLLELNYALRRKLPSRFIPVILEEQLKTPSAWPSYIGMSLGNMPYVDFSNDSYFDASCEALVQRIFKISRTRHQETVMDSQVPSFASKEEQHFFQWMARSTKITESSRVVYCCSLVQAGVSSVQLLAQTMVAQPNFLNKLGINQRDADEIVLAISDLGLGGKPSRDFTFGATVDDAMYALNCTTSAPADHSLAVNALACVTRLSQSGPDMPMVVHKAGITPAIVKVLQQHIGDAGTVDQAFCTLIVMATGNPIVAETLLAVNACTVIPLALHGHTDQAILQCNGCRIVAILASTPAGRNKLGASDACEAVVKAIARHPTDGRLAEEGCNAINNLAFAHGENIGKFGLAGAPAIVAQCLSCHPQNLVAMEQAFRSLTLLASDAENRAGFGNSSGCEQLTRALMLHVSNPMLAEAGCSAMAALMIGTVINRTRFGQAGACEVVKLIVQQHSTNPTVAASVCVAVYSLAAGCMDHQKRFSGLKPLLTSMSTNQAFPDKARQEAREALLRMIS